MFSGFNQKALDFLRDIRENNSKPWFEEHKGVYQEHLLEPMRELVRYMTGDMLAIDPDFEIRPAVNRTISRIYRDTRFSKDKSLYKRSMWIVFKRPSKEWLDAPAYFFELFPDSYRYGMGMYSASRATMDSFREMIDAKPDDFRSAVAFYNNKQPFRLEGDTYKRILDKSKPDDIQNWYQRKSFYLVCDRDIDSRLFGRDIADDLIYGFELLAPLYKYIWKIKNS